MKRILLGTGVTALAVALDRFTKALAVRQLRDQAAKSLIPGVLELCYVENRGMAFGLLQNARLFFVIITLIMSTAIIWAFIKVPLEKRFLPILIGLPLILGGAIGNFIDRVFQGYVVDFLNLGFMNFPVFNLADIFITWTAVILVLFGIFLYKEEDFKRLGL